jgi:2-polyprenyl-3-methyl-5-hydroxy-6-metoxy-1,4-benzoquinol methylase
MSAAQQPNPTLIFETITAFHRTEALRAAIELDIFSHIAAGRHTADAIAEACQASSRGIRILADTMTIGGFLTKRDDRYELTPEAAAFLDSRSPAYMGHVAEFLLTPDLRTGFYRLPEAVRRGGTALAGEGTVSHDNPVWVTFARAMGPLMQMPAQLMVGLLEDDRQRPLRILDVAAGHGLFGIAFAEHFPNAQITALDWANVLTVATENAVKHGVAERHATRPGSAFEVDWGGPYDLVLLTNFLHHFDLPTCQQVTAKACAALAPGGRMITLEFVPDPGRVTPPGTAVFALTMLATTVAGDAYTFAEYERVFAQAGFQRSEFHPLPPTLQQAIVSYKS